MRVRDAWAIGAVLLLAGCSADASSTRPAGSATDLSSRSPAATWSPAHHELAPAGRTDRHLTLLPPGCAPAQVELGPPVLEGAGSELITVFPLLLARGRSCTLWGTPTLVATTRRGETLRVRYGGPWFSGRARPVEISRRQPQAFPVATSRCDEGPTRQTDPIAVRLPLGAGTLTSPVTLGHCGTRDPGTAIRVGAIGSWVVGRHGPPTQVALSAHSAFGTRGLPTWGRADLDGDGRTDLVIVRPAGAVTIRSRAHTQRLSLPPSSTARLQGFADLTGDNRPDALVASTAIGCAHGYRLCAFSSTVLTLTSGRVRIVHFPGGRPPWNVGHGDRFQGWVCRPGGPTEVDLRRTGRASYVLRRTRYGVAGVGTRRLSSRIVRGRGRYEAVRSLTRTRCRGLDASGWAAP